MFIVGLGFLILGVTSLVLAAVFPPTVSSGIPSLIFGGIAGIGIGGFLASWALIGGRRFGETPRNKARTPAGIVFILAAPLVSFLLILAPIKGFFFLVFLVPGAIVLYGIFLIVSGSAGKRRW